MPECACLLVLTAGLTWNATPTQVFVFYPGGQGIEQVCIGETCFTPTHQSAEIIPWSQPTPYVRVTQRGVYHYSWPIPEVPS